MKTKRLTKAQKFIAHRYELARRRRAVARWDAKYAANMATLARIKHDMEAIRAARLTQLPLPLESEVAA